MLRGLEVLHVLSRLFGWSGLWVFFTDSRKDLAPVKHLAVGGTGTLGYALIMLAMLCYYLDRRQSTLNRRKKTITVQQRHRSVAIQSANFGEQLPQPLSFSCAFKTPPKRIWTATLGQAITTHEVANEQKQPRLPRAT
ncbi:MAG: hypothetical protein IJ228_09175 [Succinivibrio sp.]|nr:hypothetical protein [Succinivibrio sp.]